MRECPRRLLSAAPLFQSQSYRIHNVAVDPADGSFRTTKRFRNTAYSSSAESLVVLLFGSTWVFPVSNQSTDLPNSWLIAKSTAAPASLSPRSSDERCP